ncbi:TetR/AcrR family transcriptional regulator [Streptococcus minor]|uniref:TetR/AcrR family transcriptional regulator n=1 Tax=Streptococcus minor TaxID=229549 RepID=A0A3P1VCM0_9STRE|nr:TetR/AcrR family transcriptional regulator [Streptococcus minor]RRD31982.1 TetR/AcrR family transcriptional regulator [Streptococcus minor]
MTKRNISPKSLKNLYQSNQEANQLTRESIETALLHLMEKKELPQISISELVKKAGVSRNAFYRNYKSKEEILELAYERASQQWMHKWQDLQDKVHKNGIPQTFSDFLHQQKDKVTDNPSLANLSQWWKDKTGR